MCRSRTASPGPVFLLAMCSLAASNAPNAQVVEEGASMDPPSRVLAEDALATEAAFKSDKQLVHVANDGIDGQTCGARSDPCRSITRAIINASENDVIIVGPGVYGDLDKDGVLGGVGEEVARCGAMICVDKAVWVVSREGAWRTVIDATGVSSPTNAVRLWNDVKFGKVNGGFTIRGARNHAVQTAAKNVWIIGNIATVAAVGFAAIEGSSDCRVVGNLSENNNHGFVVFGRSHRVELNVAQSNTGAGFWLIGNRHWLRSNMALGNDHGVLVADGSNHTFTRNAFLANSRAGALIVQNATGVVMKRNNIFGNGEGLGGTLNIGLSNTSGGRVLATNNYWGSAMGPGSNPSDEISTNRLSQTQFEPFARTPFKIPHSPLR